jgi:hypothetical protein
MAKTKKTTEDETTNQVVENKETTKPGMGDVAWTDYVLSQLSDDEKINGNPTTDGLRRIFETILNCTILHINTEVVQAPSPENEKRATVVYRMDYILNDSTTHEDFKYRSVTGAADVYWGNCDKIYRNHPVAVAETRAEGRALRKGLRLRKVVAAEELAENTDDHPDKDSVSKISTNQINFIDVLSKRLNINVIELIKGLAIDSSSIYNIEHEDAIKIIRELSRLQQDVSSIGENLMGYDSSWK